MVCENGQSSIVKVDSTMGIVLLILNILWSGLGTVINGCMGSGGVVTDQIIVGILQFLTSMCLIGWFWSIWWGVLIMQKAA